MNIYSDRRLVGVKISYGLLDINAAGNATVSSTSSVRWSNMQNLVTGDNDEGIKYATMEDGLVKTDGSWDILPDAGTVPYWSGSLSDGNGFFSPSPIITFDLSAPASSVGFTIDFDPSAMPQQVTITVSNKVGVVKEKQVPVTEPITAVDMPVENYVKVAVRFDKMRERFRRARMLGFTFGLSRSMDGNSISKVSVRRSCSPTCANIPSAQLDMTVDNSTGAYDAMDKNSLFRFLQSGQPIDAYVSVNGEPTHVGRFYFTRLESAPGSLEARITANDRVLAWDGEECELAIDRAISFGEAIKRTLGNAYVCKMIPAEISKRSVAPVIKAGTKLREAVRQLCQAACCTCWIACDGTVIFSDVSAQGTAKDHLTADNMVSLESTTVKSVDSSVLIDKVVVKDDTGSAYTAGAGANSVTVSVPCATISGCKTVASWLLNVYTPRVSCDCESRGNPQLQLGDTITVENRHTGAEPMTIYEQVLTYNGGLSAKIKGVGRKWP